MDPTSSPIDHDAQPGIIRRATIGDPVYDNQALVRQRRKASIVACESSAAEHAALADRVRQLEARLAAVTSSEQAFVFDESHGRPELHLDTSFDGAALQRSWSFNDMSNETPMTDESLSLTVPTIQITGPHGSRPPSPSPFSPSPSLFSGTSRASSPDPFSAISASSLGIDTFGTSMLAPLSQVTMRTPPVSQWAADTSERHALLQAPESPTAQGWYSRRSSISSFGGLDQGFCAMNLEMPSPQAEWSEHNPFDYSAIQLEETPTTEQVPSKAQAELLADHAFNNILLPLERTAFKICLEAVYEISDMMSTTTPAAHTNLSLLTPYSLRMARCLVFLILSIGLKLHGSAGNSIAGIDSCYAIAHEQMGSLGFWAERGAQEVAALLAALGNVSGQ
ncbi:hypothetical protein PRZ48_004071 [Zasmidium cellare]|uniref:Uncharacterized protein n=1 Tax=Zasmidium cellare TaxID=395010 RepID=A0ABR0EYD9_ZASCE|nr:hypothetical protein PRZ48_004071 [Zasmidium cellare]